MTASNTPDQRIDDLLTELTSAIWLQAQMAILDKHESYGNKAESRELAKDQLKSLFETMIDSMWLNKHIPTLNVNGKYMVDVDWLTAELTKGKAEVISKYFGGGE